MSTDFVLGQKLSARDLFSRLHGGCTRAFFANGSAEPGAKSASSTAQHEANEAGDISSTELDAELRLILREEVFPEFVEIAFERVMKAVFSEIA